MAFSPTERLLLACAGTRGDSNKIRSLLTEGIDWEYLIRLASMHQIIPLLYHNLKRHAIPAEINDRLKMIYLNNLANNLRIDAEQNKIFKLLDDHQIDFVPLKGTVLAKLVYGDIALRQTSDIDFLVREKDLLETRNLLINDGYNPTSTYSDDYWFKEHFHLTFNGKVGVEAHWNIIPFKNTGITGDLVWQEIQPFSFMEKKFYYFNPEMFLVFTLLKYKMDSFNNLKYLIDINEIVHKYGSGFNWGKLVFLLQKYQTKKVFAFCINSIDKIFEADLSWIAGRHKNIIAKFVDIESMVKKPGPRYFEKMLLTDNYFNCFSWILGFFFPHPERLRLIYRLKPKRKNLFWYYLAYPFKVIFGGLGKSG